MWKRITSVPVVDVVDQVVAVRERGVARRSTVHLLPGGERDEGRDEADDEERDLHPDGFEWLVCVCARKGGVVEGRRERRASRLLWGLWHSN